MLEKPWTLVLDLRGYGLNYSMNILISIRFFIVFYCFYSHFPFLNMNKKKSSQKVFWSGQSFSLKLRLFEKQKISVTGWKTQFQSVQLFLCFVVVTLTTRKDRNGQRKDQLTKLPWITPAADQKNKNKHKANPKTNKKVKNLSPKNDFCTGD